MGSGALGQSDFDILGQASGIAVDGAGRFSARTLCRCHTDHAAGISEFEYDVIAVGRAHPAILTRLIYTGKALEIIDIVHSTGQRTGIAAHHRTKQSVHELAGAEIIIVVAVEFPLLRFVKIAICVNKIFAQRYGRSLILRVKAAHHIFCHAFHIGFGIFRRQGLDRSSGIAAAGSPVVNT